MSPGDRVSTSKLPYGITALGYVYYYRSIRTVWDVVMAGQMDVGLIPPNPQLMEQGAVPFAVLEHFKRKRNSCLLFVYQVPGGQWCDWFGRHVEIMILRSSVPPRLCVKNRLSAEIPARQARSAVCAG